MKKIGITLALLVIAFVATLAVPAVPTPVEVEQPNGEKITIRIYGDENSSYRTTEDGYLILQNKKGYYCYAKETCKGELKASWRKVSPIEDRTCGERCRVKKMKKNDKLYKPFKHQAVAY